MLRSPSLHPVAGFAAGLLLAVPLVSQRGPERIRDERAGLGRTTARFDLETPAASRDLFAAQTLNGELFVVGARAPGALDHEVLVLRNGIVVRRFAQRPATRSSVFGWRDATSDGRVLAFSFPGGIHVVNALGQPVANLQAQNGARPIATNPLLGAGHALLGGYLALTFDPSGNGGEGSFWVARHASELVEIDLAGGILRRLPNPNVWFTGLARDPQTGRLWASSDLETNTFVEIDPTTGIRTGAEIRRRDPAGSEAAGLTAWPGGGDGRAAGVDLLSVERGGRTDAIGYRLHLWDGIDGTTEPSLLAAVDAGMLTDGRVRSLPLAAQTWSLQLDVPGRIAAALFNIRGDALGEAVVAPIPELVAKTMFTQPSGIYVPFGFVSGATPQVAPAFPLPTVLSDGDFIRVQVAYLEPRVPQPNLAVMVTNQVRWRADYAPRFEFEAVGDNSRNADADQGFFRLHYMNPAGGVGAPSVTELTLDWTTSSLAAQRNVLFDVDESGMGGRFDAGNGGSVGCLGTYRNDADRRCGLVYDAMNTAPFSSCAVAANANTGFIASQPSGPAGSFGALTFRFGSGSFRDRVFEFDCDTDGGLGVRGGDLAGLVVTVQLSDGTMRVGELAVDPGDARRSFVRF